MSENDFARARYWREHPVEAKWRNRVRFKLTGRHSDEVVEERLRIHKERIDAARRGIDVEKGES